MIGLAVHDPIAVGWKGLPAHVLLDAGVTRRRDGTVVVPYRHADGSTYREKLFPAGDARCYWSAGNGLVPYGLEHVAPLELRPQRGVLIAEGESDALAIRGELATWRDAQLDVLGLPGAGAWHPDWLAHVAGYRRVYVAPDGDTAGTMMLEHVLADIPTARHVPVPAGHDARSILQQPGGFDAWCELLASADLAACRLAAFELAATPQEWLQEMCVMRGEGLWG